MLARVTGDMDGKRFPYARVFEWHQHHGIHIHMAVPMFYWHGDLDRMWGKGYVFATYHGRGSRNGAGGGRRTSAYLAKYVGKDFDESARGKHRYEVAQGFPIERYTIPVANLDEGIHWGLEMFPGPLAYTWDSRSDPNWFAPPVVYMSFDSPAGGAEWEMLRHRLQRSGYAK
jgi:hypothetical protein